MVEPTRQSRLDEDVSTKSHLENVVSLNGFLQFKGRSVLHQGWAEDQAAVPVSDAQGDGRPGAGHEHPIVHTTISLLPKFIVKIDNVGAGLVHCKRKRVRTCSFLERSMGVPDA